MGDYSIYKNANLGNRLIEVKFYFICLRMKLNDSDMADTRVLQYRRNQNKSKSKEKAFAKLDIDFKELLYVAEDLKCTESQPEKTAVT